MKTNLKIYGITMTLMFEMVIAVGICTYAAVRIDRHFNIHLLIFILPFLAFGYGIYRIYAVFKKYFK